MFESPTVTIYFTTIGTAPEVIVRGEQTKNSRLGTVIEKLPASTFKQKLYVAPTVASANTAQRNPPTTVRESAFEKSVEIVEQPVR